MLPTESLFGIQPLNGRALLRSLIFNGNVGGLVLVKFLGQVDCQCGAVWVSSRCMCILQGLRSGEGLLDGEEGGVQGDVVYGLLCNEAVGCGASDDAWGGGLGGELDDPTEVDCGGADCMVVGERAAVCPSACPFPGPAGGPFVLLAILVARDAWTILKSRGLRGAPVDGRARSTSAVRQHTKVRPCQNISFLCIRGDSQ